MIANNIHNEELVPPTKVHDPRMDVCYNGQRQTSQKTCCTHKMENKFRQTVDDQVHQLIQKKNSELRNLISRNVAVYQEEILTTIRAAQQKTTRLFTNTYHIATKSQSAEVERFFTELTQLYDKPEGSVSIYASVSRFFNQLFPLVFHNILNDPTAVELTDDYRKCLVRARHEIQPPPFGQAPARVSTELSQAVSVSHLFLTTLRTALESLNATDNMLLDHQCTRALVKMQHCGICQLESAKPCRNLCLNVMRGCLAKLQVLEGPWNKFIDAVSLFNAPDGAVSVQKHAKAFQHIDSRISESIMHAMENTHKFYSKVTDRCGNPQPLKDPPTSRPPQPTDYVTPPPTDLNEQGRLLRQFMFTTLRESKGLYSNLADGLCDEKEFSATHGPHCWNGRTVAAYQEAVLGKSLTDQANNPELKVSHTLDDNMSDLMRQKNQLAERITSQTGSAPQDDNYGDSRYVVYSSGDGAQKKYQYQDKYKYWNQHIVKQWSGDGAEGDDEDMASSGSGMGGSGNGPDGYNNGGSRGDDGFYIDNDGSSDRNRNKYNNNNNNRRPIIDESREESQRDNNNNNNNNGVHSTHTHSSTSVILSTVLLLTCTLWLNG